ncbi:lipid-transfer protein [Ranunculus cassubicifolius]
MANSVVMKVAMVAFACMVIYAPYAEAITCGQVANGLSRCIPYLRSGGAVPPACCSGVRSLNSAARTTPDRRTACACLKNLGRSFNAGYAASLPGKCGVSIGYPISQSVDCSR